MINSLGAGYQFGGVVDQAVIPGTSDPKFFYLAAEPGTYSNFGNLQADVGELTIFFMPQGTNAWYKQSCKIVDIVDNLITEDANKALSANQGVALNQKINSISDKIASIDYLSTVSGSAVGLLDPAITLAEFTFRESGAKGDGAALINSIKGKTLAWNQFLTNGDFSDASGWVQNGATLAVSGGVGVMTALSAGVRFIYNTLRTPVVGHKYLLVYTLKADAPMSAGCGYGGDYVTTAWSVTTSWQKYSKILSANSTAPEVYVYGVWTDTSVKLYAKELQIIDLTLLGIDNLTTVEEVEAWLATNVGLRSYYPFNAGELKSNDAQSIVTVGRNLWDEEYVVGGYYDNSGNWVVLSGIVSDKNGIKVLPSTDYYIRQGSLNYSIAVTYWDSNGNFISRQSGAGSTIITTPANCYLIHFNCDNAYGATYLHDICINLSDAAFNGTYEPYWKNTLELNIKTLTGKKDGQGASVTIFPDGAGGVGSVYDELRKSVAYKRFGIVDLGDLNWSYVAGDSMMVTDDLNGLAKAVTLCPSICSGFAASSVATSSQMPYESFVFQMAYIAENVLTLKIRTNVYSDAATFKTAMAGVKCIYQLATPETYVLDNPLEMTYKVAKGGTEERISPNADGISAPMVEEVQYPIAVATPSEPQLEIEIQDDNPGIVRVYFQEDMTGAVFISCGGKAYTGIIENGTAIILISGLSAGTYPFTLFYTGDGKYASAVKQDTITIS
jgi:hypothetical protein